MCIWDAWIMLSLGVHLDTNGTFGGGLKISTFQARNLLNLAHLILQFQDHAYRYLMFWAAKCIGKKCWRALESLYGPNDYTSDKVRVAFTNTTFTSLTSNQTWLMMIYTSTVWLFLTWRVAASILMDQSIDPWGSMLPRTQGAVSLSLWTGFQVKFSGR